MYLSLVEASTWDYERNEITVYECAHRWSVQPGWDLLKYLNCCLKPYCFRWHQKRQYISSSSNHPNHHVSAIKSWDGFISMDIFSSTVKLLTSSKRRRQGSEQSSRNPQLWDGICTHYYCWYLNISLDLPTIKPLNVCISSYVKIY